MAMMWCFATNSRTHRVMGVSEHSAGACAPACARDAPKATPSGAMLSEQYARAVAEKSNT